MDPIKDALHAAALATMTASEREHSETCHNGEPGPGHIRRAAETVAAFLRALPDDVIIKRERIGYTRNDFANMVERAARDA